MTTYALRLIANRYSHNVLKSISGKHRYEFVRNAIISTRRSEWGDSEILKHIKKLISPDKQCEAKKTGIIPKIRLLADMLDLPCDVQEVIQLLFLYRIDSQVRRICEAVEEQFGRNNLQRSISVITGIAPYRVMQIMSPAGPLISYGILIEASYGLYRQFSDYCEFSPQFMSFFEGTHRSQQQALPTLLGSPTSTTLEVADYPKHGREMAFASRLLKSAAKGKANGINILIYGEPGVGKTELAALLAKQCNIPLYSAAETGTDGRDNLSGSDRLAQLRMKSSLLAKFSRPAVILFDEMEDVIENALKIGKRTISKVYLNRLLEKNLTPVIWTTNSIENIDPAIIRRMTQVIELKPLSGRAQKMMIQKTARLLDYTLDENQVDCLAKNFSLSQAVVTSAIRSARQTNGDFEDIKLTLSSATKALTGRRPVLKTESRNLFDISLINTDSSLSGIISGLKKSHARDYSICLYGPSGTGKSAFARHLAEVLDMPLLSKKASDLLSPYVGLTEKNIAACFEKAIEQEALLLIDEADSFLQSRSSAAHSWEITAVNEMLTQMESHPLPFVCTTNLINILDEAAFRRFTLKMKFDYLTPAQLNDACQRLCGIPMNKYIEQVALGDIVVARKMMAMLAQTTKIDAQTLYKHLSAACIVKSGGKQKVGFSMN